MKEVDFNSIFHKYPSLSRENLIPILQEFQQELGYISEDVVIKVADYLELPSSKVFGLATFYDEFKFKPEGKYVIKICNGSACHILGSETLISFLEKRLNIKEGQTTTDGLFSLVKVDCLGACALAPVIMVNDDYFSRLDKDQILDIIEKYRKQEELI